MLLDRPPVWLSQLTPVESEESKQERRRRRGYLACDLLLAKLYKNHPDHAMAALKGIKPNVVDLEPPAIPEPPPEPVKSAEIVPLPVDPAAPVETMADVVGPIPSMQTIMRIVCAFYQVTPVDICSERRTIDVARPRQIAMYLGRICTTNSLRTIGRIIGHRDHSTTAHAIRRIVDMAAADKRLADEIELLKRHIKSAA